MFEWRWLALLSLRPFCRVVGFMDLIGCFLDLWIPRMTTKLAVLALSVSEWEPYSVFDFFCFAPLLERSKNFYPQGIFSGIFSLKSPLLLACR